MGRASVKENKNRYQLAREELGLSREKASDLLGTLPPERIEKIENEKSLPHPDEVLVMSQKYKKPSLCNYFCSNDCPIGREYVPEVQIKELSAIVIEMLASLNSVNTRLHMMYAKAKEDKTFRTDIPEEQFMRVTVHTMMAACTHYAGGFIWGATDNKDYTGDLLLLKEMILNYAQNGTNL